MLLGSRAAIGGAGGGDLVNTFDLDFEGDVGWRIVVAGNDDDDEEEEKDDDEAEEAEEMVVEMVVAVGGVHLVVTVGMVMDDDNDDDDDEDATNEREVNRDEAVGQIRRWKVGVLIENGF